MSMTDDRTHRRRRAVTIAEVVDFLEYLAPPSLSSPAAPFGLQVGQTSASIKTILVTPFASFSAISCAAAYKAALMVCAAPLLTNPLTSLRWDNPVGAKLAHLTQRHISLYTLVNTYAAAPGGFDDSLAERLGLAPSGVLVPTAAENQLKFVVFVPQSEALRVRRAATEAGAGGFGNYTDVAFEARGIGTFLPLEGARPAVGQVGKVERVEEVRLEMLVSERELKGVIAAVLEAHPYEEVAYDIYPLRNPGLVYGRGRIGELPLKVSLDTVLAQVNDALGLRPEQQARCLNRSDLPIGSLAVASGTGAGEQLLWAAHRQKAGALVVGGVSVEDQMLADSATTVVIDVGFAASVEPGLQRLVEQLRNTFASDGVQIVYVP